VDAGAAPRPREGGDRRVNRAPPHPPLQRQEAAAQLRLLKAQRPAGGGEPAMIDDGHEIIEVVEILHRPIDRTQRWICQSSGRASRCYLDRATLSRVAQLTI